jgi:hypothetical protein
MNNYLYWIIPSRVTMVVRCYVSVGAIYVTRCLIIVARSHLHVGRSLYVWKNGQQDKLRGSFRPLSRSIGQ